MWGCIKHVSLSTVRNRTPIIIKKRVSGVCQHQSYKHLLITLFAHILYTVDAAKKDPFCPVLTWTGGVTMVFLHVISKRNYVYPIENWNSIMFYSCQFCTWALCFRVISLRSLHFFLIRRSLYAESTVFVKNVVQKWIMTRFYLKVLYEKCSCLSLVIFSHALTIS